VGFFGASVAFGGLYLLFNNQYDKAEKERGTSETEYNDALTQLIAKKAGDQEFASRKKRNNKEKLRTAALVIGGTVWVVSIIEPLLRGEERPVAHRSNLPTNPQWEVVPRTTGDTYSISLRRRF
jgi:hypothetical protein